MFRKLKIYLHYFLASFGSPNQSRKEKAEASEEQILRWQIKLTDRSEEKLAAYKEWSNPKNIAERRRIEAEEAPKALARGLALKKAIREAQGLPLEDPPLPPQESLPLWMRGQSESTTRAMLRQQDWVFDKTLGKWLELRSSQMVRLDTVNVATEGSSPSSSAI